MDRSRPAAANPQPRHAVLALTLTWALAFAGLLALARAIVGDTVTLGLGVALFFVGQELGTTLLVASAAARGLARDRRLPASAGAPRGVSVLVAAYDEASCILETLRSVRDQEGIELELIVADDGSSDGTGELVLGALGDSVRVLRLPHLGKGAALEAARRIARHEILVTLDADTILAPDALARLIAPFEDPRVEAVAGAVVPRIRPSWLVRFQLTEYAKNTLLRRGWSELDALEQVPGAFAALRASSLAQAGGFPVDSLTEDYEVAYRLYAQAAREGRTIAIPTVASARAYTEAPHTLRGLIRQRTRWFAGFLSTLFRFRRLVLRPSASTFGLVKLPLKVLDAVLPPIGLASLAVLLLGLASGDPPVTRLSLALLAVRALADVTVHALALHTLRVERRAGDTTPEASTLALWSAAMLESFSYAWLKQLAVIRAYPFALARVRTWEHSRDRPAPKVQEAVSARL